MQLKRGLGRGLESLIPPPMVQGQTEGDGLRMISIDSIVPNRLQPRSVFDEEKIRELADSIREQGVLQPLAVSPIEGGRYELIAGERRFRASRLAGLSDVPVVIRKVDDEGLLALSIMENVQREDLNPIEESRAYLELTQQFGYTQDDVAKKVGKSRVAVANSLRLLALPRVIQDDVASGRYTAGHARAILAVEGIHEQLKLRERILREVPTVRDVEKMVQSYQSGGRRAFRKRSEISAQTNELLDTMKSSLGTKVSLLPKGNGGKLIIEYYSAQDLDRIYKRIINH
ncbi:MAG: ParB/RepB/Spo0J family partition protein [Pseudomonadota bacterium]